MNPFTIKNGILTVRGKRIILAHVCAYDVAAQTIVVTYAAQRETINLGSETDKLAAALDQYFESYGN